MNALKKTWKEMLEGPKFSIVQSCLVTLENAMYDLIDGIDHDCVATPSNILDAATNNNEAESSSNGDNIHELLQSPSFRSELELESIGQKMTSLWTSAQVRSVFLAIVQHATELGVLALCLDLLQRNCTAYIKSNTVKKSSRSASRANTDKGGVADVDRDYYYEDEYGVTDDMYQPRPSRSRLNRSQRPQQGFHTDFFFKC
uniref:Uncharacterized protein n=1 Tax=Leptocylindrus danicus TaxID=163516 RepID=A0A7S2KV84_9STRA|mmetsp:Transcript_27004/g.39905  ORF Transcript_27004/g.39905 Transcript_27004/m.39905 type:complete len:201 (+) Transcript_27004:114-716(+)